MTVKTDNIVQWAFDEGFMAAAVVDTERIIFDPSFRPYCEENLCGQYGVNYSCPPDCGSPEEMKERILRYPKALVLQTVWSISDYCDAAAIKHAKSEHNGAQLRLVERLRGAGYGGIMVGASGCALCEPCARRSGESCRLPELRYSCMSAYCIFVRKLAEICGMDYDCGEGKLAFFGMYAFE